MPNQYTNPWTPEEDDYLHDSVGMFSYNVMSAHLGRTVTAIKTRIDRLGIADKHAMTGTLSARQLAMICNVDPSTVPHHWIPDGLKARQKVFTYRDSKKNKPYYIFPEDFWEWANTQRHRIAFSKIERGVLLPEPEWLEEAIQEELNRDTPKNNKKEWSPEEDNKLWNYYYKMNMKQKEIAILLGRTRNSVERRLSRIRKKKSIGA